MNAPQVEPAKAVLCFKDLPLDIRDYLLTLVSNLSSLQAAVQASKSLLEALRLRERTIVMLIAKNEIGLALPYARSIILATQNFGAYNNESEEAKAIILHLKDTHLAVSESPNPFSRREAFQLVPFVPTVRKLETYFSIRSRTHLIKHRILS